jgi:hypothetical protein
VRGRLVQGSANSRCEEGNLSEPCPVPSQGIRFELRFTDLLTRQCEYAFPCDKTGLVDIDELTDRRRADYFYARTMVGKELSAPVLVPVRIDQAGNENALPRRDERELAS